MILVCCWITLVLVSIGALFFLAGKIGKLAGPETARKTVHTGMGLICALFPWIFESPGPVWILALLATLPLLLLRMIPALRAGIGRVLHEVKRPSYGEILFAPAVALVFHLADGRAVLFVIPVLILAIADAAGALAGVRWGRKRYGSGDGFKSCEGSLVFLVAAFLCVFVPLVGSGTTDVWHALWIGITLGLLATMVEGFSDRGFDNLILPVGCFFLLERLAPLSATELGGRLVALVLLLGLVICVGRWSTLNGGALLGAAMLGYGCAVLAGWQFVLPLLGLFAVHLIVSLRNELVRPLDHRMDAVLSLAMGAMPWGVAVHLQAVPREVGLAGLSAAMATHLAILHFATDLWLKKPAANVFVAAGIGWIGAGLPGLIWLRLPLLPLAACMTFAAALLGALCFQQIALRGDWPTSMLWIIKGCLALVFSLLILIALL